MVSLFSKTQEPREMPVIDRREVRARCIPSCMAHQERPDKYHRTSQEDYDYIAILGRPRHSD